MTTRFPVTWNRRSNTRVLPYFSPDGTRLVVESGDRAVLWDLPNNKVVTELSSYISDCNCNRSIYYIEFSPDGSVVAVAFGAMGFIWDTTTGDLVSRLIDKDINDGTDFADRGAVLRIAFSRDGQTVFTGSGTGSVKSWNVATGSLINSFKGHKLEVSALSISSNGKVLASGSRNQDVKLWDVETGRQLSSLDNRKEVRRIWFNQNGSRLMTVTSTHIFMWNTVNGAKLAEMPNKGSMHTQLSPDWRFLLVPDLKKRTLELYELGK